MLTRRLMLLLMLAALGALVGCSAIPGGSKGSISFREIFESRRNSEMQIVRTVELDVDEDNFEEWLVLYRYDPTLERRWANAPIQGIVYDAIPCDPPEIQEWRLPFPDNDYLGEGEDVEVSMEDLLANTGPNEAARELVISGDGPVNTLSIYRFHDYQRDPCKRPDESKQGFSLLGFFRANGPIRVAPRTTEADSPPTLITTYQRTTFERSQLAIRSTYQPQESNIGETFVDANGRTIAPSEQTVDFLYGYPESPVDSPYPEKAVAAFYLGIGTDPDRAARTPEDYLTEEMKPRFNQDGWGLGFTPDLIRRVLINSISYTPDREAELQHLKREVTVVVVPVTSENERQPPRRITWELVGIPIPGQPDCEWRLSRITSTVVTDGLGYLPTPSLGETAALVR